MNDGRRSRQIRLLPGLFYAGQAITLGRPPATVTDRDHHQIGDLLHAEEATFAEVKAVIEWLWFDPRGDYWRTQVADIRGFCNAYPTLCDRMDETFIRAGTTSAAFTPARRDPLTGARLLDETDIDRIQREAMKIAVIDDDPLSPVTVAEARQQARAMVQRLPERKDLED